MKECKDKLAKLNENVALTIEQEKMLHKKITSVNQVSWFSSSISIGDDQAKFGTRESERGTKRE